MKPRMTLLRLLLALVVVAVAVAVASARATVQEWPSYGGDPGGMRFSPLKQIHRGNVGRLTRAWTYHTGDLAPGLSHGRNPSEGEVEAFESTPLMVDGVLYVSTPSSRVIALDAETGKEMWKFDPQSAAGEDRAFNRHRGVAYWEKGADKRIIFGTAGGRLIALDARTGRPRPDFGDGGFVRVRSYNSPPAIYRDLVIMGSNVQETPSLGPSGMVRAFDARTGRLVWEFHTVPGPGEAGHETWDGDSWINRSGTNAWAPHQRGREARDRVSAARFTLLRFLWSRPHRPEPLRQFPCGPRCGDRQAALAFPGRPPRPLGLRPAGAARSRNGAAGRPRDPGRSSGHEDGICVRA